MKQSSSLIPVTGFQGCSFSCIVPTTYGVPFLHPLGLIVSYRAWFCLERGRILLDKGEGLPFLPGFQPTLDTILHIAADLWLVWQGLGSSICIFATHALPLSTTLFREQLEHVGLAHVFSSDCPAYYGLSDRYLTNIVSLIAKENTLWWEMIKAKL